MTYFRNTAQGADATAVSEFVYFSDGYAGADLECRARIPGDTQIREILEVLQVVHPNAESSCSTGLAQVTMTGILDD